MSLSVINVVVCAALFWTCFCRACKTDKQTYGAVRAGIFALAVACVASAVGPWVWDVKPNVLSVALTAGMLLTQVATARSWHTGTPTCYQRSCQ